MNNPEQHDVNQRGCERDSPPLPISPPPHLFTVTVIIPALNEEHALPLVLRDLPAVGRVIVVDNGSTDATAEVPLAPEPSSCLSRDVDTAPLACAG